MELNTTGNSNVFGGRDELPERLNSPLTLGDGVIGRTLVDVATTDRGAFKRARDMAWAGATQCRVRDLTVSALRNGPKLYFVDDMAQAAPQQLEDTPYSSATVGEMTGQGYQDRKNYGKYQPLIRHLGDLEEDGGVRALLAERNILDEQIERITMTARRTGRRIMEALIRHYEEAGAPITSTDNIVLQGLVPEGENIGFGGVMGFEFLGDTMLARGQQDYGRVIRNNWEAAVQHAVAIYVRQLLATTPPENLSGVLWSFQPKEKPHQVGDVNADTFAQSSSVGFTEPGRDGLGMTRIQLGHNWKGVKRLKRLRYTPVLPQ